MTSPHLSRADERPSRTSRSSLDPKGILALLRPVWPTWTSGFVLTASEFACSMFAELPEYRAWLDWVTPQRERWV